MEVIQLSEPNSVSLHDVEILHNKTKPGAGTLNTIAISFAMTEPVMEAMKWKTPPEFIPNGPLDGRIAATNIIFTPTDKKLSAYEMQFPVNSVENFRYTSEHDKETGKVTTRTYYANITTESPIAALVENWLAKVGEASAVAKVTHMTQETLPLGDKQQPLIDGKQKVLEMRTKTSDGHDATLTVEDPPVTDNDLLAAGSGRTRRPRRRGGEEPDPAVAAELAEREALKSQLTEQLQ